MSDSHAYKVAVNFKGRLMFHTNNPITILQLLVSLFKVCQKIIILTLRWKIIKSYVVRNDVRV